MADKCNLPQALVFRTVTWSNNIKTSILLTFEVWWSDSIAILDLTSCSVYKVLGCVRWTRAYWGRGKRWMDAISGNLCFVVYSGKKAFWGISDEHRELVNARVHRDHLMEALSNTYSLKKEVPTKVPNTCRGTHLVLRRLRQETRKFEARLCLNSPSPEIGFLLK